MPTLLNGENRKNSVVSTITGTNLALAQSGAKGSRKAAVASASNRRDRADKLLRRFSWEDEKESVPA